MKTNAKKWTALLALILALILPCGALAAPGDANLARDDDIQEKYSDYIRGACVCGDTLYLYGNAHLFSYHIGDADLTATEYELPQPEEENTYNNLEQVFSDGEELYMMISTSYSDEDYYGVESLEIYPVEFDGEKATLGEGVEVDIDELTTDYGDSDNEYLVQINYVCSAGSYLFLDVYDGSGYRNIYQLDAESGEGEYLELDGVNTADINCVTPYEDGQLLIEVFTYDGRTDQLYAYDPEEEELTPLCEPLQLGEYNYGLSNLVYSAESGKIFYREGGFVMAMENFDYANAQQVAELSSMYGDTRPGLLLPGDYYVYYSYDNTAIRNTDPSQMAQTRLIVQSGYSDSMMDAYYAFGNTHGDVAVVLDNGYRDSSQLIEAMMARDDSVDIYTQSVGSQAYDALFNRDYMLELTDPKLTGAVEKMYPFIQDVCMKDGVVKAVPVNIYGWTVALDVEGFELIGIHEDELPTSWKELLEFLPTLEGKIPEDKNIYVFDEYNDQRSIRYMLYSGLMDAWRTRLDAMGQTQYYDDPDLIEMMNMIRDLDLGALGVPEPQDDSYGSVGYSISYGGDNPTHNLVQFSVGATIGNFYGDIMPTPISVLPGEPAWIPLTMQVAFVNPFSKHPELAQEFLATVMDNMDDQTRYNVSDELNDPVRDENMDEIIEEWKKTLEDQKAALETADEIDKPAIEENIKGLEDMLANQERYMWRISAEEIEWFRSHAQYMTVERYNYMYSEDDDSGEIYELQQQMYDGKIEPAEFLKQLDHKVRMRAAEGN